MNGRWCCMWGGGGPLAPADGGCAYGWNDVGGGGGRDAAAGGALGATGGSRVIPYDTGAAVPSAPLLAAANAAAYCA